MVVAHNPLLKIKVFGGQFRESLGDRTCHRPNDLLEDGGLPCISH
jgi:hypothetical protein